MNRGLALGLGLLVAEIGARIAMPILVTAQESRISHGRNSRLIDLVRRSAEPSIIYELRPGLACQFMGVDVSTNSHGFRGPERLIDKAPNGFRVLALGDSVLFGWGLPFEESGVARLERILQERLTAHSVEVIGTGVPGYNTAIEAAVLQHKGLAWDADVVLVDFVGNDFELPKFLLAPTNYLRIDHSFLLDLARRLWRASWRDPRSPFVWTPEVDGRHGHESDPARVPAEYRSLVGREAYYRALVTIQELGRVNGFHVLVTTQGSLGPVVAAICEELGLPTCECWARIDAWMREHGIERLGEPPLTISVHDMHPSALLHGFWAEAVTEKLHELGWLPR